MKLRSSSRQTLSQYITFSRGQKFAFFQKEKNEKKIKYVAEASIISLEKLQVLRYGNETTV